MATKIKPKGIDSAYILPKLFRPLVYLLFAPTD
jgi:hypothetical protein